MKLTHGRAPEPYEWMRLDPGYDVGPIRRHELLDWRTWLTALVCFFGLLAFLALVIAVVPGPAS